MGRHDRQQTAQLSRIADAVEHGTAASRNTARPTGNAAAVAKGRDTLPLMASMTLFFNGSKARSENNRRARRTFPIVGYVGPNGGGKSLAAVQDSIPSLRAGRPVLSTVALLDAATGKPHPAYVPFTDFDQLLIAEHCDVVMDEIVGIANSRDSSRGSLSPQVQNLLVQLRRRDVVLRWTAPNWARSDKIIREVTQAVVECRGYFPGRPAPAKDGESLRLWAPRRVFHFRTFDTADFEEWTAGKRDKIKPVVSEWFKGPGSEAFSSYDTLDSVSMVAHASESGQCETCGGTIRKRSCVCGTDHGPSRSRRRLEHVLLDDTAGHTE